MTCWLSPGLPTISDTVDGPHATSRVDNEENLVVLPEVTTIWKLYEAAVV
jgi:hypothetical protein